MHAIHSLECQRAFIFRIYLYIAALFLITTVLIRSINVFEAQAHFSPNYQKLDILPILEKSILSDDDYHLLFYQTGLSPSTIDEILAQENQPFSKIQQIQTTFFEPVDMICAFNSPISKEEKIILQNSRNAFAPYGESYILLTSASHTFFYRNGHAALIIDGKNHKTLEAVALGSNSSIQNVKKWTSYPNFILLRLKNVTPYTGFHIASTAKEQLHNIPYRLTAGLFTQNTSAQEGLSGTQCAHLVWYAFWQNGYDIDSDGGKVVTPHDLLESDLLEIVQIYGFNPYDYEKRILK